MPERERLPDRRAADLVDFEHDRRRWTVPIHATLGRVAELFIDAPKESVQDGALAASLALQSGCPLNTLRHALAGRHAGPLGVALGLIEESRA